MALDLKKEKRLRKRKMPASSNWDRERKVFLLVDALQEEEVTQRGNLRFPLGPILSAIMLKVVS